MRLHAAAPVTRRGVALHALADAPPRLRADTLRPYVGILGVLIGSIDGDLGSRVTTFRPRRSARRPACRVRRRRLDHDELRHRADDESASPPPISARFSASAAFCCGASRCSSRRSLLAPLSPNLDAFLAAQFLGGVGSGTFIPLTISFIVRSLPPRLVIYGLAVYAMNSELSQNVGASLEGWYADHWSWRWIDWQYCLALPLMFVCILYGVPREDINMQLAARSRLAGARLCRASASRLLYAGPRPGQSARLDAATASSIGLLIAGALLTLLLHRARTGHARSLS